MQDRTKDSTITVIFIIMIFSVFLANLIVKDKDISETERRKLASFPEITKENITDEKLSEDFEGYFSDQFVGRDLFRSIKTFYSLKIFGNKDTNGLFVKDDSIYKMDYKLNKDAIKKSAEKIDYIYDNYLKDMNVYYSIIPDKNYYLKDDEHLKMDYDELKHVMEEKLEELEYIDIWDSLNIEDYYKTDLHWKQEKLENVANTIQNKMGVQNINLSNYRLENRGDFYGVYYGQLGIKIAPDKLYTLTNDIIENSVTIDGVTGKKRRVYDTTPSKDKYDIYLSGAVPLISIENSKCESDKELLLFRDSFGSSIAPLFLGNYRKITLVDIRYISSKILKEYIDFNGQDVLFLYSTTVLNSNILK